MPWMVTFDVFRQISFIAESLQAGTKQTSERLFTYLKSLRKSASFVMLLTCMLSLMRVKLGLREKTLSTAFTEQFIIS